MVAIGDICTIPGNLEKSFDQISKGIGHVASQGVFPVVLGGDHSIAYPTIRGLAPYVDGNIGIIHFDRHVDTQELDLDHGCTRHRGSTPQTSPTLRQRTSCRSASAGGKLLARG